MHPAAAGGRPRPAPRPLPSPGPAQLGAAVDVVVGHLRRMLLLRAWEKWQPVPSQGEIASRLLERQRLQMKRSPSPVGRDSDDQRRSAGVAAAAGEGAAGAESTRGRGKLSTLERDGRGGAGRDGGVSVSRSRSSPAMGIGSGGGGLAVPGEAASRQRNGMHRLTMQACFKEEREAFIRDLQVLHRQLEAKDRDRAKREREHREASTRAKADARSAQERAVLLRKEAEEASAGRAAAEARAQAAAESLDRQTAAAESLRARLRHAERQHKEQMDLERRQQNAAAEDAHGERRRLESAALTARKALSDGRREWSIEKDTLLIAIREAGHRADLAVGEATEANAHAVLLEERLQQTLEREASLNATVEKQREAARDSERRVATAEADAGRASAAAAAQEEASVQNVKDLEQQASRAEMMRAGEQARREDLQAQLEEDRETSLEALSAAQRESSAANRRFVSLGEEAAALRRDVEVWRGRAQDAERLVGAANASSEKLGVRLKEAYAENDSLAAAAAEGRQSLQKQWQRREEVWRLALERSQQQQQQQQHGRAAYELGKTDSNVDDVERSDRGDRPTDLMAILSEVEKLQATVLSLSREKENLLRLLALAGQPQPDLCANKSRDPTATERESNIVDSDDCLSTSTNCGKLDYGSDDQGNSSWSTTATSTSLGSSSRPCDRGLRRAGLAPSRRRKQESTENQDVDTDTSPLAEGRCSSVSASSWVASRDHNQQRRQMMDDADCEHGAENAGSGEGRPGATEAYAAEAGWERGRRETEIRRRSDRDVEEGDKWRDVQGERSSGEEEEEEGLIPRGGPAPVPSPLTPRSRGGGGGHRDFVNPAGRSVAAAALLRATLERERETRAREHETLLALIRRHGDRNEEEEEEEEEAEEEGASEHASWEAQDAEKLREMHAETRDHHDIDANTNGGDNTINIKSETPASGLPGDGFRSSKPENALPLSPEVWCGVVSALERTLARKCRCCDHWRRRGSMPGGNQGGGEARPDEVVGSASSGGALVSSVLELALRELLASTGGVDNAEGEGLREASLPELVEALRREWDTLLDGLARMQVEVEFSRRQVAPAAAATKAGSTVDSTATAVEGAGGHPTPPGTARSPRATPVTSNSASTATAAATEEAEQRAVKLERALAAAEEARIAVEGTVQEAEDRLAVSERERSEAIARLDKELQHNAAERAAADAERSATTAERAAERSAAAASAASAAAIAAALRRALEDQEREAERLREAVKTAELGRRRAEEMWQTCAREELDKRQRELERAELAAMERVASAREEGRREAELRVEALESALDRLAETGSAAEGLSKEQLEITRELSSERDELFEENQLCNARLEELTIALREQREEKATLGNKLLDRERGLEALRAQAAVEGSKVARLQAEVEKAQAVCKEMTDRLLELQETQGELRRTRESLAQATRELETLRPSRDQLRCAWDEARRAREELDNTRRLGDRMSARAAAAEAQAEESSRRAIRLEARVDALQHQLDQVPNDMLVAHAEKRVLQGALDQAAHKAAEVEASAEAELRRRDADVRNFAAAAALEQERCGQRLREQALTIHQLTLQGFSAEARAQAAAAAAAAVSEAPRSAKHSTGLRGSAEGRERVRGVTERGGVGVGVAEEDRERGTSSRRPTPHTRRSYDDGKGSNIIRNHSTGEMFCADRAGDDHGADGGGCVHVGADRAFGGVNRRASRRLGSGWGTRHHFLDSGFPVSLPFDSAATARKFGRGVYDDVTAGEHETGEGGCWRGGEAVRGTEGNSLSRPTGYSTRVDSRNCGESVGDVAGEMEMSDRHR